MACPKGSDISLTLADISQEITVRICELFADEPCLFSANPKLCQLNERNRRWRNHQGRACNGGDHVILHNDPNFRPYIQFYEFFDAETGRGCGASHQLGWTALVAKMIQQHTMPWATHGKRGKLVKSGSTVRGTSAGTVEDEDVGADG
jgi:hypothetical protein